MEHINKDVSKDSKSSDNLLALIHKQDINGSGKIDFIELGNFLIKGYCVQLSMGRHLLKRLEDNKKECTDNDFDYKEFKSVINDAFAFLSVSISDGLCQNLYKSIIADGANKIGYIQIYDLVRNNF